MTKKPRFYGWEFGDSQRDQVVLEVYQQFRAEKQDFADYCKDLIYRYVTGQLVEPSQAGGNTAVLTKLDEIKRMLLDGSLTYNGSHSNPGTDDQELLNLLGNVGT